MKYFPSYGQREKATIDAEITTEGYVHVNAAVKGGYPTSDPWIGWDLGLDFEYFKQQFNAQVGTGTVPALNYITLPNDHTNGVRKNYPTPKAMVADNDLGLGQLVDLISHSPILLLSQE